MKFFFDNNLSPSLAHGIAQLSKYDPSIEEVIHLRDKFPANAPDIEWLNSLAKEGGWNVISLDNFKKNKAERQLIRHYGLNVFVLDAQWNKQNYWLIAQRLVLWWPKIITHSKSISKAAVRVPWHYNSKSRFVQI